MAKKSESKEGASAASPSLVKVKALRTVSTSLYGKHSEGQTFEVPSDFAEQLYLCGDVEILEQAE